MELFLDFSLKSLLALRCVLKLTNDQLEEVRVPDGRLGEFVDHSGAILWTIQDGEEQDFDVEAYYMEGMTIGEAHKSISLPEDAIVAATCETTFDINQAMSETCGYSELKEYYATASAFMMQGFATGVGLNDVNILECTETEDDVESEMFGMLFSVNQEEELENLNMIYR